MFSGVKKHLRMARENAHVLSTADVGQELLLDGLRVVIECVLAEGKQMEEKTERKVVREKGTSAK